MQNDLYYLGGLFDGEGSINVALRNDRYLIIKAQCYNSDETILQDFVKYFGGAIYIGMDKRPKNKPCISGWTCSIGGLETFLDTMQNYCRERDKVAKMRLALDYMRTTYHEPLTEDTVKKRQTFFSEFNNITKTSNARNVERLIVK